MAGEKNEEEEQAELSQHYLVLNWGGHPFKETLRFSLNLRSIFILPKNKVVLHFTLNFRLSSILPKK